MGDKDGKDQPARRGFGSVKSVESSSGSFIQCWLVIIVLITPYIHSGLHRNNPLLDSLLTMSTPSFKLEDIFSVQGKVGDYPLIMSEPAAHVRLSWSQVEGPVWVKVSVENYQRRF